MSDRWFRGLGLPGIAFSLLACFGCDEAIRQPSRTAPETGAGVVREDASASVSLTMGDERTLKAIQQKHLGKVVLVDFWATWCVPCVLQFPHTVELAHRYGEKGMVAVSVSMNEPSDRESVLAFLRKANADFDNLITEYGAGAQFVDAFELRGDVPFYKLYDRKGTLRYVFSPDPEGLEHGEPIEQMERRIEELLSEPAT